MGRAAQLAPFSFKPIAQNRTSIFPKRSNSFFQSQGGDLNWKPAGKVEGICSTKQLTLQSETLRAMVSNMETAQNGAAKQLLGAVSSPLEATQTE